MATGDNAEIFNGFGCTRFPVDPDLVGVAITAANLDSGQDAIIGLLKAAINADLGAVWTDIVSQLPAGNKLVELLSDSNPVNFTTDSEPNPSLTTQQYFGWPALAVWPKTDEAEEFELTMALRALRQPWGVVYLIGPLDAAWQRKLGRGICRLVYRSVRRAIRKGYHPAYQGGKRQFFGQFSEITCKGCVGPGVVEILDKEKGIGYYGIQINLQTVERTVQDDFDEIENPANYGYVPAGTASLTQLWSETRSEISIDGVSLVNGKT